jgi:pimeloyl-ACP methyl ester carboxylesterase
MAPMTVFAGPAAPAPAPVQTPDVYASAGERVTIAPGRALSLRCSGTGPRTVLLEAGGNADSTTWFRVQPLVKEAKICAYDRAGYGFSDPGPLPRDLQAGVDDLHALVQAAKLETPLVLVGHSLGANLVRRYALQHPADVAALVLVDPPEQGAQAQMPAQWKRDDAASLGQRLAFVDACTEAAEKGTLDAAEGPLQSCLRAPPDWQSAAVAAATRAYKLKPGYWRALRSQLEDNTTVFADPVPDQESHGDTPVIVLTAPGDYAGVPDAVRDTLQAARKQTQARLVASSSRGRRIDVDGTSHDIQLDRPEVVVEAIQSALTQPRH